MGFGSYDESEQREQTPDRSAEGAERVTRTAFDGEFGFESGANTDTLLAKLDEIKAERNADE